MDLIALAQQPAQGPVDAAESMNTAGLATILWIVMLAVVFFILLAAAALGLLSGRRRRE